MRQLLTESLLLSLAGGAAAIVLAFWSTSLLVSFKPENLPRVTEIGVDARVLAFTLGSSVLTGLIVGLVPAWTASRGQVGDALKEGGRSSTAGSTRQRLRSAFVVVELAVALVLLVGAGLLVKTFWNLRSVDPGFNPENLVTMRVELPETRYEDVASQTRFRKQVLAGMNSLPGVQAAMISELPLSGDSLNHDFLIENRPPIAPGDEPSLETRSVLGDYFKVMQIPLQRGRDFTAPDFDEKAPMVGIANDQFEHIDRARAQREANPDLLRSLRNRVRHDAVNPDRSEDQSQPGKHRQQRHVESPRGKRARRDITHRLEFRYG
jgi:putative ABC transport system permease protein